MKRFLVAVALSIAPVNSMADLAPGSLAHGPYLTRPPHVFAVQKGKLALSEGNTIIERSLQKYESDYGVRITQQALAGYIIDLDQKDPEVAYEGFDLDARLADPNFAPWFHDPFPEMTESNQYTQALWRYATTGSTDGLQHEKINMAVAYIHIDHAFFPLTKFGRGYYVDAATNVATDEGFESVLHEALHIWHFRNHAAVTELLRSSGSYFDRAARAEAMCAKYKSISSIPKAIETCGFKTEADAVMAVLKQGKWPQRHGALTLRRKARVKDRFGCSKDGKETVIENQLVCIADNEGTRIGDLHAFDNEAEYFAILMQLYVFSPADFQNAATPTEAAFAKRLFRDVFGSSAVKE